MESFDEIFKDLEKEKKKGDENSIDFNSLMEVGLALAKLKKENPKDYDALVKLVVDAFGDILDTLSKLEGRYDALKELVEKVGVEE